MSRVLLWVALMGLAGCAQQSAIMPVSPEPAVDTFKNASDASQVTDSPRFDSWWRLYQDPLLVDLQRRLMEESPALATAASRYDQVRASTATLRSRLYPSLSIGGNVTRNRQSADRPLRGTDSPDIYDSATLGLDFGYELDVWGRVRRQIAAGIADEEAAYGDLAAVRLALQIELTDVMLQLRGADENIRILQKGVDAYVRFLDMIQQRHQIGITSGLDLAQATTQLEATRSRLEQARAQRLVLENAVAVLVGENPTSFKVRPLPYVAVAPQVPTGMPSSLLQRRPDVYAAQQRIISARERLGVAKLAYYPAITLRASGGYQGTQPGDFISAPNLFWALGPGLFATIFDGGARQAEVKRNRAVLEEAGQQYKVTVLQAFQQVEDQLALVSQYKLAAASDEAAVVASDHALQLAINRYREGVASYLDVISAQTSNLQARSSALELHTRQVRATLQLIKALGGGWDADASAKEVALQARVENRL